MPFPKRSKTIVLIAPKPMPDGDHSEPDSDFGAEEDDSVDLESNGDAPKVYAGNLQDVPDFLQLGYEGMGEFKFKITDRTDNPDGTTSLELELHSLEPSAPLKPDAMADSGDAVSEAWDAAENGDE